MSLNKNLISLTLYTKLFTSTTTVYFRSEILELLEERSECIPNTFLAL